MQTTTKSFTADTLPPTIPVFSQSIGSWRISVGRFAFEQDQLARSYDAAAPAWNKKISRLGMPKSYENLFNLAIPANCNETGTHVLDCGIGTGALSAAYLDAFGADAKIHGLDISPRMLEEAERSLEARGASFDLRLGDAEVLPFADNAFDVVMSAHMLEHLFDPRRAVSEMLRVLKPGGRLILCITRRTVLGMVIHLLWRTHRVDDRAARDLLSSVGLSDVTSVAFGRGAFSRNLSMAYVGVKSHAPTSGHRSTPHHV